MRNRVVEENPQYKEDNDDWSSEKQVWGEQFALYHETSGNEAVGDVAHTHAEGAIDQFVHKDASAFWPGDAPGTPEDAETEDLAVALWEGEKASAELRLATSDADILDEWESLMSRVEGALPDEWTLAEGGVLES